MACSAYPQTEDFQNTIRIEAEKVIRKLRNHPSLLLWCGDNECDEVMVTYDLDPNCNKITRKLLPEIVTQCDPYRTFIPSSPYYSPEASRKKNVDFLPERHLWGPRDYYKSRFYIENKAHFVSEIGYHGCPSYSSIIRFIDQEHIWPWEITSSGCVMLLHHQV